MKFQHTRTLLSAAALLAFGCGAEPGPGLIPGVDSGLPPDPTGTGGAAIDADGTGGTPDGTGGAVIPIGGSGGDMGMDAAVDVAQDTAPVDVPVLSDGGADVPVGPFTCNQLLGPSNITQWWPVFEALMNGDHWQYMAGLHAFVDNWADPNSPFWTTAVTSPCTSGAKNPDRVLLVVFSTTLTQAAFQPAITKAVATIKTKYPGVKRIELLTNPRSPMNKLCTGDDPNSVVPPYIDQAIQNVADQSGGDVTVGPKIEVGSCTWWDAHGTDFTSTGAAGVGALYGAYYKTRL
ncbi:MAG TPA: hypothetical protein VH374_11395 [Polyangia bacterium]|nr:hypothetical protein [Polyangia bacterium]